MSKKSQGKPKHYEQEQHFSSATGGPPESWLKIPKASRKRHLGFVPGERIIVTRGLERVEPKRCLVTKEYGTHIVFEYEAPDGSVQHFALLKSDIMSGQVRLRRLDHVEKKDPHKEAIPSLV